MNESQYDKIAEVYDSLFNDQYSQEENAEVGAMLRPLVGTTLDIGCGTGLLTEIVKTNPETYMGIDPSKKMVNEFRKKHVGYGRCLVSAPFDGQIVDCNDFDNVVSLFGSASYLSREALLKLATSRSAKFLMFYKPEYKPVTYEKCNVVFEHYKYSNDELAILFGRENLKEYHNYIIVKTKCNREE